MIQPEFGFIAADTSRSRCYLAAMERSGVLPSWIMVLANNASLIMPGQSDNRSENPKLVDTHWPEIDFDPSAPLTHWLARLGLPFVFSESSNINHPSVVRVIAEAKPSVVVYSGYGGAILRDALLATGKRFLHVHGGYLPNFKGSTTNYYSLLVEGDIGASAIFLTSEIDSGPVVQRRKFAPPADRAQLDHVYDSAARARVLVDTLRKWVRDGDWSFELSDNSGGDTYYVIHPVLKHLAILGK